MKQAGQKNSVEGPVHTEGTPESVCAGMRRARVVLHGLAGMAQANAHLGRDLPLLDACGLLLSQMPPPRTGEAVGFAMVLGEYLAVIADGMVQKPGFKLEEPDLWQRLPAYLIEPDAA